MDLGLKFHLQLESSNLEVGRPNYGQNIVIGLMKF